MRSFLLTTLGLMLCLVLGCKGGVDPTGKWNAAVVADPGFENDPGLKLAEGFLKGTTFEFKADKTFTGTMILPIEGTYTVDGKKITLNVTKAAGMDAKAGDKNNKPMVFEATDSNTLTAVEGSPSGKSAHFKFTLKKQG